MPTKTVVFCDLYKYSNDGNRLLYSHEFIQMAGRAGRRNIDTLGHIILLPQIYRQNLSNPEIVNLLSGTGQIIESKFEIDEELILKMIGSEIEKDKLIEYLSHSMLSNTNQRQIIEYGKMLDDLQGGYDKIDESYISSFQKIDYYSDLKMNGFKLSKKQDVEYKTLFNDTDLNAKYALKQKYDQEKKKLEKLKLYIESEVDNMLNILSNNDMVIVKPDNMISLTNRGVIGSFILECNPIVVTDILTDPLFELLEVEHIITLLSTITFDDHLRDSIDFNGFKYQNQMNENYRWIKLLDGIFDKYDKSSMKYLIDLFNYDYVWLLDEFIRTGNYNSKSSDEDYLFEGNFVRSVNKLLNLLNEIRDIYEKTKNYDLMNKIDIAKTMLQKDWLKPESLYLKI
jgi:superfamily II RNA helicase